VETAVDEKRYSLFHDRKWVRESFDTLQGCWDYCKANGVTGFGVYETATAKEGAKMRDAVMWTYDDDSAGIVCIDVANSTGEVVCF